MSTPAPLHQTGLVERVAAVFALAGAGDQFIFRKPLADDLRAGPHCSNDLDGHMDFVVDRQAAEQADGRRKGRGVGSHLGVFSRSSSFGSLRGVKVSN
jgi:hypothetical protein